MLWSVIRDIFKTRSVTPDFFYLFYLILSFSTFSQNFNKSVRGKFWARTSLRTFARNFSNIDFFLKILPLKDDELAMSEM